MPYIERQLHRVLTTHNTIYLLLYSFINKYTSRHKYKYKLSSYIPVEGAAANYYGSYEIKF